MIENTQRLRWRISCILRWYFCGSVIITTKNKRYYELTSSEHNTDCKRKWKSISSYATYKRNDVDGSAVGSSVGEIVGNGNDTLMGW